MKIVYSRRALEDIESIGEYLRPRSLAGPQNVRNAIRSAIASLAAHPLSGRLQDDGSRKIVTKRYDYLIYYDVNFDLVDVLTIQHGARRRGRNDV